MSTYYIKGGSRFNEANPNVWVALHLAGYTGTHYLDTGWKDFNTSGANEDPYWRLGGDGGLKEVEIGLSGQQRIKINTAGIWGWHVTSGAWFSLYESGAGAVGDHGELEGLGDDDHSQYLNIARGDARYYKTGLIFHTGELYHTGQLFTSTYIIAQYTSGNIFVDLSGDYLITSGDYVTISGAYNTHQGDANAHHIPTAINDTPTDAETTTGVSSNWAYDHLQEYNATSGAIADYGTVSGDYVDTSGMVNDYPTVSGDYSTHQDNSNAHHTPPGAGDLLHNELGGLNAGTDYEHLTQAQKDDLHTILDGYTQAQVDALIADFLIAAEIVDVIEAADMTLTQGTLDMTPATGTAAALRLESSEDASITLIGDTDNDDETKHAWMSFFQDGVARFLHIGVGKEDDDNEGFITVYEKLLINTGALGSGTKRLEVNAAGIEVVGDITVNGDVDGVDVSGIPATVAAVEDRFDEQSAAFPGSPVEGDLHYDEDLDSLYRYNGEAENWVEVGVGGLIASVIDRKVFTPINIYGWDGWARSGEAWQILQSDADGIIGASIHCPETRADWKILIISEDISYSHTIPGALSVGVSGDGELRSHTNIFNAVSTPLVHSTINFLKYTYSSVFSASINDTILVRWAKTNDVGGGSLVIYGIYLIYV